MDIEGQTGDPTHVHGRCPSRSTEDTTGRCDWTIHQLVEFPDIVPVKNGSFRISFKSKEAEYVVIGSRCVSDTTYRLTDWFVRNGTLCHTSDLAKSCTLASSTCSQAAFSFPLVLFQFTVMHAVWSKRVPCSYVCTFQRLIIETNGLGKFVYCETWNDHAPWSPGTWTLRRAG